MSKTVRIIFIFLVFDLVVVGAYFGIKSAMKPSSAGSSPMDAYEWKTMDEYYQPADYVEQFIKDDAAAKGIFPVEIRNYGKNGDVLKRFKGKNFARSSASSLDLAFPGLDDWTLVDVRYKNEKQQEIARTILYVSVNAQWRVGDSGTLVK
jgi:hypothetical protein